MCTGHRIIYTNTAVPFIYLSPKNVKMALRILTTMIFQHLFTFMYEVAIYSFMAIIELLITVTSHFLCYPFLTFSFLFSWVGILLHPPD